MWRMRVIHATGYAYRAPVTASYNEARLTPRSDSRQNVIINRVETAPAAFLPVGPGHHEALHRQRPPAIEDRQLQIALPLL